MNVETPLDVLARHLRERADAVGRDTVLGGSLLAFAAWVQSVPWDDPDVRRLQLSGPVFCGNRYPSIGARFPSCETVGLIEAHVERTPFALLLVIAADQEQRRTTEGDLRELLGDE